MPSKNWHPSHLRLAATVVSVRDKLRQVDWTKLDQRSASIVAWSVRALSAGLKAREHRPARDVEARK